MDRLNFSLDGEVEHVIKLLLIHRATSTRDK
jgi:hypothetical protein